jgi:two-component system sensor histidine kinase/response regulator
VKACSIHATKGEPGCATSYAPASRLAQPDPCSPTDFRSSDRCEPAPAARTQQPRPDPASRATNGRGTGTANPFRTRETTQKSACPASILVIADEADAADPLRASLTSSGYAILRARTGDHALGAYAAGKPDAVLVNASPFGIAELDTCRRLLMLHGEACAPILLVRAAPDLVLESSGLPPGVIDILPAPLRPRDALVHIRAHIEGHRCATRQRLIAEEQARANLSKTRLLGMCAHDLRNPICAIRGMTEFLQDPDTGPLNPQQGELVAMTHDVSHTMLMLVNELLDLAAIESGGLRLNPAPASLRSVITQAVRVASVQAARKRTRIEFSRPSADPELTFDAPRIRQVVDNLVSNAVKFSPPGSCVTVSIAMPESSTEHPFVWVCVQDQGPGIPEAERARLYTEFGRLSPRPTAGENSSGLGLAICRAIVEAHGGSIDAINQPHGGCVFCFNLPCQPCP